VLPPSLVIVTYYTAVFLTAVFCASLRPYLQVRRSCEMMSAYRNSTFHNCRL